MRRICSNVYTSVGWVFEYTSQYWYWIFLKIWYQHLTGVVLGFKADFLTGMWQIYSWDWDQYSPGIKLILPQTATRQVLVLSGIDWYCLRSYQSGRFFHTGTGSSLQYWLWLAEWVRLLIIVIWTLDDSNGICDLDKMWVVCQSWCQSCCRHPALIYNFWNTPNKINACNFQLVELCKK
jgi:hypothetical protein